MSGEASLPDNTQWLGVRRLSVFQEFTLASSLGSLCILLSIVEFGVGGSVYSYLISPRLGAWWGGIMIFFTGVSGAFFLDRGTINLSCALAFLALLIAAVGTLVDGLGANAVRSIETCIIFKNYTPLTIGNTTILLNPTFYGSSQYQAEATDCYYTAFGDSIKSNVGHCICTNTINSCFDLHGPSDCSDILGEYSTLLTTSAIICAMCTAVVFSFLIVTCTYLCKLSTDELTVHPAEHFQMVGEEAELHELGGNLYAAEAVIVHHPHATVTQANHHISSRHGMTIANNANVVEMQVRTTASPVLAHLHHLEIPRTYSTGMDGVTTPTSTPPGRRRGTSNLNMDERKAGEES